MTIWVVQYWPYVNCDLDDPGAGGERPCFRIVPEDDPERWIAQTNPYLPPEVQEEAALLMAEALSQILGV
jgi:hypothetical protein